MKTSWKSYCNEYLIVFIGNGVLHIAFIGTGVMGTAYEGKATYKDVTGEDKKLQSHRSNQR